MRIRTTAGPATARARAGITLTEILISIMILGIGLVSLATLFPIGLLRLREAQRQTRSSLLFESAACDVAARGLFNRDSFLYADLLNDGSVTYPYWYPFWRAPNLVALSPLVHDTPYYGGAPTGDPVGDGASSSSYGLPFAYDPLWRYQTGFYLDPANKNTPEFRFADGSGLLRDDPDGGAPSAKGLQRLTNFNRPGYVGSGPSTFVPSIFVSPEDIVWQDSTINTYNVAFTTTGVGSGPSPLVPDLSMSYTLDAQNNKIPTYQPMNDFRFSWMLTARQTNGSAGAAFEGNVVVFENRSFAVDPAAGNAPARASGEFVCEGVFGYSKKVQAAANSAAIGNVGYGTGADRTVLVRWGNTQADPVVKVGDWIADVTYERNQAIVANRFLFGLGVGAAHQFTFEWENMPAQRCFWYQVQKVSTPQDDPSITGYRSMVVYVNRKLEARTVLDSSGNPVYQNAVLICPQIVNVIPQTFFLR